MKAKYLKPSIVELEVSTENILAGSTPLVSEDTANDTDALSKNHTFSVWDESSDLWSEDEN